MTLQVGHLCKSIVTQITVELDVFMLGVDVSGEIGPVGRGIVALVAEISHPFVDGILVHRDYHKILMDPKC